MKQNFKLLFLASILAICCGLDDLGKPLIYSFTRHKHYQPNQGFLAYKQTEGTPQDPPTPTDPQPNKPDLPNTPTKPDQPNQPNQPTQPVEEQGGGGWGVFFAIVIVILVIVGIVYLYNMYEEHVIKTEGTMKAELGIKKQNLNSNQKLLLNLLTFNSKSDEFSAPYYQQDVEVKHQVEQANSVVLGEYLQAIFKQPDGQRLIICNYPCNQKMDCCYFEVELEKINSNNYDQQLSIGFIAKSQLEKFQKDPGNYELMLSEQKSVLYSSNGLVMVGQQEVDLGIEQITYGDAMGIGYTKKDQRIWITRNGEFLNPPPLEEIRKLQELNKKNSKQKDEEQDSQRPKEEDQEQSKKILYLKQLTEKQIYIFYSKVEEEKMRRERVLKLKLDKQKEEFEVIYPFVSTNFPCTIDINVGGYPFRFNQKEIATGLLK